MASIATRTCICACVCILYVLLCSSCHVILVSLVSSVLEPKVKYLISSLPWLLHKFYLSYGNIYQQLLFREKHSQWLGLVRGPGGSNTYWCSIAGLTNPVKQPQLLIVS